MSQSCMLLCFAILGACTQSRGWGVPPAVPDAPPGRTPDTEFAALDEAVDAYLATPGSSSASGPAAAAPAGASLANANNPLANMTALNFQNYYIGELTESDENGNQFWLRFAKPFSVGKTNWLLRASLPVNTFPTSSSGSHETGLGDFNVFAAYLIDVGNPAVSFAIGPQLTLPTATESALGTEKWSAGLVNVLFDGRSKKFQYGYLLSWQHSFAGDSDRSQVNVGAFQPFAFYQLGKGVYLRAAPIWVYNFQDDSYSMPLGIGIGKAVRKGKTVFNFFVEPQYSVADQGAGQPQWQVFFGLNLQFLG